MILEFTKDYATKKKGEIWDCTNSMLTARLLTSKVAKKYVQKRGRKPKKEE